MSSVPTRGKYFCPHIDCLLVFAKLSHCIAHVKETGHAQPLQHLLRISETNSPDTVRAQAGFTPVDERSTGFLSPLAPLKPLSPLISPTTVQPSTPQLISN